MFGKKRSLGLALGGGAVRGFAHIGVLKAMHDAGVVPKYVAGTSVGSPIGALYCAGRSWSEIRDIAFDVEWKDFVQPTFPKLGVVKPDGLRDMLDDLLDGCDIADLKVPFAAVAVDLVSCTEIVIDSGSVSAAVLASCSIPGIFVPIEFDEMVLVDGGVLNAVPADVVAAMGGEYVIAVDLNADTQGGEKRPENILDVMARSMALFMSATSSKGLSYADCIVQPDLKGFSYHDMSRREEMVERGEQAMRKALGGVRRKFE
jgi:NTE family protein